MAKNDITTFQINTIAKGLRPTKRAKRDSGFLVECKGAVGRDEVLQVIDQLSRIDTSSLTVSFPYPQLFVMSDVTIVCTSNTIYELVSGSLVQKITSLTIGTPWSCAEWKGFVVLNNGKVTVTRVSNTYSIDTRIPIGTCVANYNNARLFIGSPGAIAIRNI
jgi:hypothetical protein